MQHPGSIEVFLNQVKKFRDDKGIAGNLFFAEIEHDIQRKTDFIKKQTTMLEAMVKMYTNMLVKISVL